MSENSKRPVSTDLTQNIEEMEFYFHDCADIKKKQMKLGRNQDTACYLTFIEVSVDMGTSALGETLKYLNGLTRDEILCTLQENALGISDATYFSTIEEAVSGLLTGEAILFVDGFDRAVKIPDDGYPNMGITEVDSEKVIRGSNEGFCDSVKQNAALIRKRIRSPRVKVRGLKAGIRSNTNVYIVYVEDLANPGLVKEIEKRLQDFTIDGILDSGMLEQLAEKKWYSPFPQFQTTQRPDRAAMAVLEGRVIVMCDNSPIGLILPTDYNSFIRTSDDYYSRFEIATFGRILRYLASFFAMTLPGFYLAVTNFHTQILQPHYFCRLPRRGRVSPFRQSWKCLSWNCRLNFCGRRACGFRCDGKYHRDRGWPDHRTGGSRGKSGQPDRGDRHLFYCAMFFCNTERRICHSLPYPEILFYCGLCVAWLLWHATRIACGTHTPVASDKLCIPYLMRLWEQI